MRDLEVREIVPFPVLNVYFEPLGSNEKHLVKEVFDQRPGGWINNSISCLDNSISRFVINFEPLGSYENDVENEFF